MKNQYFEGGGGGGKNGNVEMKMYRSNGWDDTVLIFSWEAASAGCRALVLMVGSQPTVFFFFVSKY